MEGKIFGNRYEIIQKIGGGGMALVYKAKCRLLNRFVAVKVLRSEFINDEEFVKRFRIEAQSAASLSHPNIVPIYDVGQEGSVHYIVMEYIDGITLKEYIETKGALHWEEAVKISVQICSALEHAHRNHIVHRDIKPHNILITKEGVAKVTDFGIARAVASSTITMVGSTIGSVHYFSPEQARGGFIDEKSDLYSLGIAMYEMVTGKLPFNGDTPVSVALKHLQDNPVQPKVLSAEIPAGVNDIIMKAIEKEQSMRYQTASDMLSDLYKVIKQPEGGFVMWNRPEENPTKRVKAIGDPVKNKDDYLIREENMAKVNKKKDKLAITLAIAVLILIIGLVSYYVGYKIVIPSIMAGKDDFIIKNYVGRNITEVKGELERAGVRVEEVRKNTEDSAKDIIISQKPEVNKVIKLSEYNPVELVVSDGPKLVDVPDLKNMEYRDAENKLIDEDLTSRVIDEYSDTVAKGLIVRTDPEYGRKVKAQSEVILYKSIGPEPKPVQVPDLTGKTQSEAQQILADLKLAIGNIYPEAGSNYEDVVEKQDPLPGNILNEGDKVDIYFKKTTGQVTNVQENLVLVNPDNYKDKIKVRIEITPSDSGKVEVLMDGEEDKANFPLSYFVPVPENGKTAVSVFLDGILYQRLIENSSEVH